MKCFKFAVSAGKKAFWGVKVGCEVLVSYNQLLQGDLDIIILRIFLPGNSKCFQHGKFCDVLGNTGTSFGNPGLVSAKGSFLFKTGQGDAKF